MHDRICDIAKKIMPGPTYREVLKMLHDKLAPRTYLEIGVHYGGSLRLANADTTVIGVDPQPMVRYNIPKNVSIFRMTSDAFFEKVGPFVLRSIDLAFIDGLHTFEQALYDLINIERYSTSRTVVAIHDTLPVVEAAASRTRDTSYWCGDVWKIVTCLEKTRPDLSIDTLPSYPSGLTLVSGMSPLNRFLGENVSCLIKDFATQPFSECEARLFRLAGVGLANGDLE